MFRLFRKQHPLFKRGMTVFLVKPDGFTFVTTDGRKAPGEIISSTKEELEISLYMAFSGPWNVKVIFKEGKPYLDLGGSSPQTLASIEIIKRR